MPLKFLRRRAGVRRLLPLLCVALPGSCSHSTTGSPSEDAYTLTRRSSEAVHVKELAVQKSRLALEEAGSRAWPHIDLQASASYLVHPPQGYTVAAGTLGTISPTIPAGVLGTTLFRSRWAPSRFLRRISTSAPSCTTISPPVRRSHSRSSRGERSGTQSILPSLEVERQGPSSWPSRGTSTGTCTGHTSASCSRGTRKQC